MRDAAPETGNAWGTFPADSPQCIQHPLMGLINSLAPRPMPDSTALASRKLPRIAGQEINVSAPHFEQLL